MGVKKATLKLYKKLKAVNVDGKLKKEGAVKIGNYVSMTPQYVKRFNLGYSQTGLYLEECTKEEQEAHLAAIKAKAEKAKQEAE